MARRTLRALDARIIKKTVAMGAKEGIAGVSTKEIAATLGITEPTIYVHFKTKGNLLESAYKDCVEEIKNVENAFVNEYLGSPRTEDDLRKLLLSLIKVEGMSNEKISYITNYERDKEDDNGNDDYEFFASFFTKINAPKENLNAFFYVLKSMRVNASKDKKDLPINAYKALSIYLK